MGDAPQRREGVQTMAVCTDLSLACACTRLVTVCRGCSVVVVDGGVLAGVVWWQEREEGGGRETPADASSPFGCGRPGGARTRGVAECTATGQARLSWRTGAVGVRETPPNEKKRKRVPEKTNTHVTIQGSLGRTWGMLGRRREGKERRRTKAALTTRNADPLHQPRPPHVFLFLFV